MKKEKWDGKSRPSTDLYRDNFDRIFKTNPVAKEVRTSKYKSQIVPNKKIYSRKKMKSNLRIVIMLPLKIHHANKTTKRRR